MPRVRTSTASAPRARALARTAFEELQQIGCEARVGRQHARGRGSAVRHVARVRTGTTRRRWSAGPATLAISVDQRGEAAEEVTQQPLMKVAGSATDPSPPLQRRGRRSRRGGAVPWPARRGSDAKLAVGLLRSSARAALPGGSAVHCSRMPRRPPLATRLLSASLARSSVARARGAGDVAGHGGILDAGGESLGGQRRIDGETGGRSENRGRREYPTGPVLLSDCSSWAASIHRAPSPPRPMPRSSPPATFWQMPPPGGVRPGAPPACSSPSGGAHQRVTQAHEPRLDDEHTSASASPSTT